MSVSGEEGFRINISFYAFNPRLSPLGVRGHEIFNLLFPIPKNATYQILLRFAR